MIGAVYWLCVVTSVACAALLVRGWLRTRTRLLLWSALCFCGLAANNLLLVVDQATPAIDLSVARTLPAVAGMALLLWGLIWDT